MKRTDPDILPATLPEQAYGPTHQWECICEGQSRFFFALPGENLGDHYPECPYADPGTFHERDTELAAKYGAEAPPVFVPREYCDYDADDEEG